MSGAHAVHPRLGAASAIAREHPAERGATPRAGRRPVPAEAGRGRHRAGQHGGQRRLVDLHDQPVDAGQPAAQVGDVVAHALGQRLGQLAAGAVVGEHLVAARRSTVAARVHGPATWILNAPA